MGRGEISTQGRNDVPVAPFPNREIAEITASLFKKVWATWKFLLNSLRNLGLTLIGGVRLFTAHSCVGLPDGRC